MISSSEQIWVMVDKNRITCGVIANLIIYAYLIYWLDCVEMA